MYIQQGSCQFESPEEIQRLCAPLGIETGHWEVSDLQPEVCRLAAKNPEHTAEVLQVFEAPLQEIKAKNGYLTEDVVCMSPETPNLDTILAMFDKEHHHTDDEVRVILFGRGIFGIVPPTGEPFEIHVSAGDLLVVPAYTRHWFTLYPEKEIVALRIFKAPSGWTAIYDPSETPVTA